jgi:polysaccharide chain length determinant protein (PEP-CTERM system associated)
MLPGKSYSPDDLLRILRRRYWLLLVPLAIVAAGTALVARAMPDLYRSETLILVIPQQVPENYVRQTVTTRVEDQLQSMRETILSRTRLETIIREFDLYPEQRQAMIMEDVVALMRANVDVQLVRNDAFRIAYVGHDPEKVMRVTDRLAAMFIEESYIDRQSLAEGTDSFLESQLRDVHTRLLEREKQLEAYRRTHAGELPSQIQANLQQATAANQQVQSAINSVNVLLQQRLLLERQLGELQAPGAVVQLQATPGADGAAVATSQQLATARAQLAEQERRLRPGHPDLEISRRTIRDLEARLAQEMSAAPRDSDIGVPPAELARRKQVQGLEQDIAEIDRQVAQHRENERQARATAALAQQRIDAMPTRESEMTELLRDYGALQGQYEDLLMKREQAKIAANLERRQIGQQFRLLDPAQAAERPFSPNRPRMNFIGMIVGLALGAGLLVLAEYRDRTFKRDDDITAIVGLPVLAVIPLMQSEEDRRSALWRGLVTNAGLGVFVAACLAFVAYVWVTG